MLSTAATASACLAGAASLLLAPIAPPCAVLVLALLSGACLPIALECERM